MPAVLTARRSARWDARRLGPSVSLWSEGARSPITRAAGMAAQFTTGNTESLSRASNASLQAGAGSFFDVWWVYFDTLPGAGASFSIVSKWGGTLNEWWSFVNNTAGTIRFGVTGTLQQVLATTFGTPSTATWYMGVMGYDAVQDKLFISINAGALDYSAAHPVVENSDSVFRLGARDGVGSLSHNGRMQCVGHFKGLPTAAMITALYNGGTPLAYDQLPTDIKALDATHSYWELGEPSGTRKDLGPSANDLTDNNTVTTAAGTCLNAISQINDLSDNARHLVQATQALRPRARTLNGRCSMLLDGTDDYLSMDALAALFTGADVPYTAIIVFKSSIAALDYFLAHLGRAASNTPIGMALQSGGGGGVNFYVQRRDDVAATVTLAITTPTPTANPTIFTEVFAGTTTSAFINSAKTNQSGSAIDVGTITFDQFTVGARRGSTIGSFVNGHIAAVLILNRAVASPERVRAERYLARQYGVVVG